MKKNTKSRIFARQIARELTNEDLAKIAGGAEDGETWSICCGSCFCKDWDDSDQSPSDQSTPICY
jgi:hypothetical protein